MDIRIIGLDLDVDLGFALIFAKIFFYTDSYLAAVFDFKNFARLMNWRSNSAAFSLVAE